MEEMKKLVVRTDGDCMWALSSPISIKGNLEIKNFLSDFPSKDFVILKFYQVNTDKLGAEVYLNDLADKFSSEWEYLRMQRVIFLKSEILPFWAKYFNLSLEYLNGVPSLYKLGDNPAELTISPISTGSFIYQLTYDTTIVGSNECFLEDLVQRDIQLNCFDLSGDNNGVKISVEDGSVPTASLKNWINFRDKSVIRFKKSIFF